MSKPPKPILVFDTCALNRIAYASDSNSLVKGLTTAYSIKLSMLNLGEIYATQNSVTRDHLIQTLRPIVSHDGNDCWLPPHAILRRLIDTFKENREDFDWRSIDLRFPAGADEIARGEFLTDETSSEQLQHQVKYKKQFATLMKSAKSSFDAEFSAKRDPPPPEVFRDTILAKGEALWSLGKSLFAGNSEETLDDDAVTTLYNCCPPYQAFVLAMFISFYDNSIESPDLKQRGEGNSVRAKASRNDLFQSIYLPYCDVFISDDEGCVLALDWVSKGLKQSASVSTYSDFIAPFLMPIGG